ncbi:hypothetical protein QM716_29240, partial [Rhodococcus sp. IEGM 1409]|nr:hypothetical protein [Rhodococcus sp. IEGM 1409]
NWGRLFSSTAHVTALSVDVAALNASTDSASMCGRSDASTTTRASSANPVADYHAQIAATGPAPTGDSWD